MEVLEFSVVFGGTSLPEIYFFQRVTLSYSLFFIFEPTIDTHIYCFFGLFEPPILIAVFVLILITSLALHVIKW
jgi:hypothetical protein